MNVALSATPPRSPRRQRSEGHACISALEDGSVGRWYQRGAARVRLPHALDPALPLEAVLMNTAGGVAGGDRFVWEAEVAAGAALCLTTASCEKFYRSEGDTATVAVQLAAAPGALLEWLPQESIAFAGARVARRLELRLAGDARALLMESWQLGRLASGEGIGGIRLQDQWRVWRDDTLLHAEALRLDDQADTAAALNGYRTFATLLYCSSEPDPVMAYRLEQLRGRLRTSAEVVVGSSWLPGRLLLRLLAANDASLRATLATTLMVLRDDRPLPRVWQSAVALPSLHSPKECS